MQALKYIDPLLKTGCGFTMTGIRDFVMSFSESTAVYNYDIKHLLSDHYGEGITFCQPQQKNRLEM